MMITQAPKLFAASSLLLALASSGALAGTASPSPAGRQDGASTASVAHKAVSTYINNGSSGGLSLVPGFNNIDVATKINCANTAGCTISASEMIQIAPPAGTNWAICPLVDGVYMNPPCPFQGLLPGTNAFVTGNGQSSFAVTSGTHTVQTQVYVDQSTALYNWQVTYTVYKP